MSLQRDIQQGLRVGADAFELLRNDEKSELHPLVGWDELIEDQDVLEGIYDQGFTDPSLIQCQAIPVLVQRKASMVAQAESGSGKTVAFLVSMMLSVNKEKRSVQAVCLAPTRELVLQMKSVFDRLNEKAKISSGVCLPKISADLAPKADCQIVFGTPQSVYTAHDRFKTIDLSGVELAVLDEGDTLLDPNSTHLTPTKKLLGVLTRNCRIGCFSATFPDRSLEEVKKIREDIEVLKKKTSIPRSIGHYFVRAEDDIEAKEILCDLYRARMEGQTIVFCESKVMSAELQTHLKNNGYAAEVCGGQLAPEQRDDVIARFRKEAFKVLIATDVLSKGLDIDQVFLVVCMNVPEQWSLESKRLDKPNTETYLHRAGRAGRFGKNGICISIIQHDREERFLREISQELQFPLNKAERREFSLLPHEEDVSHT
jgi:ATP-dependent RNA helicase DDX19/DBP5